MIEFKVNSQNSGKKLDRVLETFYPNANRNTLFRAFRKKDVKINGIRVSQNVYVNEGDYVQIYMELDAAQTIENPYEVVFADENILIVNKKQGIPVQQDKHGEICLIDLIKKEFGNNCGLCHRLDRNTGGLVIIGRTQESTNILIEKIQGREISKFYHCLVQGKMPQKSDVLTGWLFKDAKNSSVLIYDNQKVNCLEIKTAYKVLDYDSKMNNSKIEIDLLTGRTHQIRAHMAHIGHPVIGDGKYGSNDINAKYKLKYQALWAVRLEFHLKDKLGMLGYLSNAIFTTKPSFM